MCDLVVLDDASVHVSCCLSTTPTIKSDGITNDHRRDEVRPRAAPPGPDSSFSAWSSLADQNARYVVPFELSENRWSPANVTKKGQPAETELPEVVDRKVRAHYVRVLLADEEDD